MPVPFTILLCLYPIIVHLSVYFGHLDWAVFYFSILLALPFPYILIRKHRFSKIAALSAVASIIAVWLANNFPESILFSQPVITNMLILTLVLSTLTGKSVSIIGRLAKLIKPNITDKAMNYCRGVTWAWAIFFLVNTILSLYLALFASIETWSLYTNFLVYVLIGAIFVVEFAVRKIVMKDQIDRGFVQFIRDLKRLDYGRIAREWKS